MKILVIQQKMIGDVLTSTIICENVKKAYPNAQVHYLVYAHTDAVVVNNPYIDKIIRYQDIFRKDKIQLFKFLLQIRKEKYDIIIDAYGKIESNLVVLFSGANTKISYHKWYSSWLYSHQIKSEKQPKHGAIHSRLSLLSPLKIPIISDKPKIYLSQEEKDKGKNFLQKHNICNPMIMISALGSSKEKTYPLEYMARVIENIVKRVPDCQILLNYMPSQKDEIEKLYQFCHQKAKNQIHKEVYTHSLRDFLAVLHHCSALIGNEGGAVNMAKALDIPTFSIYSPQIKKEAWNLFADEKNVGVHISDYLKNSQLYSDFVPKLFENELDTFIQHNILKQ